jgi:hypothetical protein
VTPNNIKQTFAPRKKPLLSWRHNFQWVVYKTDTIKRTRSAVSVEKFQGIAESTESDFFEPLSEEVDESNEPEVLEDPDEASDDPLEAIISLAVDV